jgi:hypothetical protein
MHIVGAGLAGLIAANLLRHHDPVVFESQTELPNNHSAVLRFRSPRIGDLTGIQFHSVTVMRSTEPWLNQIADSLAYSRKCTGLYRLDRSISRTFTPEAAERYIAPHDLVARLAKRAGNLQFGVKYDFQSTKENIISTIPMPSLMKALEYPKQIDFKYVHGFNLHAQLSDCDAYCSVYVPDPQYSFNRISITGDELIAEYSLPNISVAGVENLMSRLDPAKELSQVLDLLGLLNIEPKRAATFHLQRYSKILPIADAERKAFIAWATDKFGIFSLGRFATWRPGLLLDDLANDVMLISRWLNNDYDIRKHRGERK